jgi:hypothetical protein
MAKKFKHTDIVKEINLFMSGKKGMMLNLATNRYAEGENTLNLVADSSKKDYPVDIAESTLTYDKEGYVIGYTEFSSPIFHRYVHTRPKHDHFDKEHIKTIMVELHMLNMFLHYLLGEPKPPIKRVGEK